MQEKTSFALFDACARRLDQRKPALILGLNEQCEFFGAAIYNQAVRDVQERLRLRVEEIDIEVHEDEFTYWRKFDQGSKRR